MVASLKIHDADEVPLPAWTGQDLPGAIVATPVAVGEIPAWALSDRDRVEPVQIEVDKAVGRFSLAGLVGRVADVGGAQGGIEGALGQPGG